MTLVDSLLTALVRADGHTLVLHVGERPYVLSATGQVELSSRALTPDAMSGMLAQLLPPSGVKTLEELGAVEHSLPTVSPESAERFVMTAARGGHDTWIEIRRLHAAPSASDLASSVLPSDARLRETAGTAGNGSTQASPRRNPDRAAPVASSIPPVTMIPVPPSRAQAGEAPAEASRSELVRFLRAAVSGGASALYLVPGSRPSVRVDGEIRPLDGETPLAPATVESLVIEFVPEPDRDAARGGHGPESVRDVADVGRVRCVTFRDHRGVGAIFGFAPPRTISAEQLGLSREIQALCAEADGLVLVTGLRDSGKRTLMAAFVDLITRSRNAHIVTLERRIERVHEGRGSLVSQREVYGDGGELAAMVRAALRENPDVLVIEDVRMPELAALALDAAASGHLVIASILAASTSAAVDRIVDLTPAERRPGVRLALADTLRGVVAQVLVRKSGRGRLAAREVLLGSRAVADAIAEGRTSQLALALESGRKYGMVPLNDALVAFVQSGAVDAREAYRQTPDKPGFLGRLKQEGIDTSFVDRLA